MSHASGEKILKFFTSAAPMVFSRAFNFINSRLALEASFYFEIHSILRRWNGYSMGGGGFKGRFPSKTHSLFITL
jgi:hypothetical protein